MDELEKQVKDLKHYIRNNLDTIDDKVLALNLLGDLECFLEGKEYDEDMPMVAEQRRQAFIVLDGNKK